MAKKRKPKLTEEQMLASKKLETCKKALQKEHDTLYRMEGNTPDQRRQVDSVLMARQAVAALELEYNKLF